MASPTDKADKANNAHTPTPWVAKNGHYETNTFVWQEGGDLIATVVLESNAAFIVEACNNYEALLSQRDGLRELLQEIDQGLWQNFVSVRKRPTLADIAAIWELSQKWRASPSPTGEAK